MINTIDRAPKLLSAEPAPLGRIVRGVQLTIWGIPVQPADARALFATLLVDGHPEGVSAATAIDRAPQQALDGTIPFRVCPEE